jgi:hypothetical protein
MLTTPVGRSASVRDAPKQSDQGGNGVGQIAYQEEKYFKPPIKESNRVTKGEVTS